SPVNEVRTVTMARFARRCGHSASPRGVQALRLLMSAVLVLAASAGVSAQRGRGAGAGAASGPAGQANAPLYVTGNWVALVNEDWRWRMVTPAKGDYASVPISDGGRKVADTWDPSKDGSCLAY